MGVIGDIPNVNVFNTVSSLSLLLRYECREFIKILGEVVVVVDKVGVPEGHQVGNELFIGVYRVFVLIGCNVVITSTAWSSVVIVSGVALIGWLFSELSVNSFRFLVISAGLEGNLWRVKTSLVEVAAGKGREFLDFFCGSLAIFSQALRNLFESVGIVCISIFVPAFCDSVNIPFILPRSWI